MTDSKIEAKSLWNTAREKPGFTIKYRSHMEYLQQQDFGAVVSLVLYTDNGEAYSTTSRVFFNEFHKALKAANDKGVGCPMLEVTLKEGSKYKYLSCNWLQ